ncbi:helix-turn-helix domain-containing protein [Pimelobacter simplex]|uniref:helix-turn-helix domain-containing protein n=1 Tax=Nocardioides simplex TaxID=2045 RepID=UPI003AB0C01A
MSAHRVRCHLDDLLAERGMTLTELVELVDITRANLSKLKNDRAQAIKFSTLTAICEALDCELGELLSLESP